MIGLILMAAFIAGCEDPGGEGAAESPAAPPPGVEFIRESRDQPGWIAVRCRLTVPSEQRIELEFTNTSSATQTFLLGEGMPPYSVPSAATKPGRLIIQAYFFCHLRYTHDDFHAQSVSLGPSESRKFDLAWRIPDALAGTVGKAAMPCHYRTLRRRDEKLFPVLGP